MTQNQPKLSVLVPTGNREDVIEDCLKSVQWADELVVVDSFSTDGTLDIARAYADRILQHEYINSAVQKNWAIPQVAHDWVLIVDTDERVPQELREEIWRVLAEGEHAGYQIPRINYVLGEPIYHAGYFPDYQLRLFQREKGRYDLRKVHAHVDLDGSCGLLESPLIHYSQRSMDQTLKNILILMTTWEAEEREERAQLAGHSASKNLWMNLTLRPLAAFGLRYVREGGWRDGYRGLIVSLIWAMYVAVTYMKIYERSLELPEHWWQINWNREANA